MAEQIAEREYSYDELDKDVQERLLEQFRDHNTEYDWWDGVYEDAVRMGELLGFEIAPEDIQFSGFWSQGDGASFKGRYTYRPDAIAKITDETGGDEALIRFARALDVLQVRATMIYGGTITAIIGQSGRYQHSHTMFFEECFVNDDDYYCPDSDFETELIDLTRSFADWIYKQLEAEYDHLTSDECVLEQLAEHQFNAHGDII